MSAILDELFANLDKAIRLNTIVLGQFWQLEQKKESNKTPDDWQPYTTFIPVGQVVPVLGHNANRASCSLQNTSSTTAVALCNKAFDPTEALDLDTTETVQGTFPFLILPAGQSTTIGSRGAVYGLSISSTNAVGLSIVETVYAPGTGQFKNPSVPIGHAALLEKGLPLDAEPEDRQKAIV